MPGRAEDHQFVLHPRFDDQLGVPATAFDQAEIELVARQLVDDRHRVVHRQVQRALGVALEEVGDDQRRQVVADGQRRSDAQLAVAGAPFEHALDRRRPLDQLDRLRQQGLAEFVEAQRLAEPIEQLACRTGARVRPAPCWSLTATAKLCGSPRNALVPSHRHKHAICRKVNLISTIRYSLLKNLFYKYSIRKYDGSHQPHSRVKTMSNFSAQRVLSVHHWNETCSVFAPRATRPCASSTANS
jgi:hypothetical protein